MGFIILVSLVAIIVGLFVGGGLLVWVSKLFKIENSSYKKSLVVLIVSAIVSFVAGIIFSIINLGFLSKILASVVAFFVFHYFYKKYYLSTWKKSLGIYVVFGIIGIVISLFVVIPTRFYIFSPFVVNGEAMSPAYNNNDYLLINKFSEDFSRGDVIVFQYEKQPGAFLIKRIIGLPGEKVEIKNGKVFINDRALNESYYSGETAGDTSVTLTQDQYFVLGDNRTKSLDSRIFGPITKSSIEGKVFYRVSGLIK